VPVLLYHGIAQAGEFANAADAEYGVAPADFAKQMALLRHAGYRTITLADFVAFVQGEDVELPPRPLLLTFDDARADSWVNGDAVLADHGFNAVMFVDAGRVEDGDPEYLTWDELAALDGARWELQLHSGHGHRQIRYGPGESDFGAFYAYREEGESLDGWRERAFPDLEWGAERLASEVPGPRSLAFSPPYGNYGQDGTNDPAIPDELLPWLLDRYAVVFTQDRSFFAQPGGESPYGRLQVLRSMTGGELHAALTGG
jgi:peptidoglycan/xylan/chitin deacetylase (PgdA/CDA1 family)